MAEEIPGAKKCDFYRYVKGRRHIHVYNYERSVQRRLSETSVYPLPRSFTIGIRSAVGRESEYDNEAAVACVWTLLSQIVLCVATSWTTLPEG